MAWTKQASTSQSYTTQQASAAPNWLSTLSATLGTQVAAVRGKRGANDIDFTCVVNSEFPFVIASNTNAVISSGITQGAL